MKKLFLGILLINLIISVINPLQAKACNCYIPDSALEAMESASAVIQGKVIDLTTESIDNEKYYAALIEVSRIWKGTEDSQIIVYTSWSSCQFEFEIGQEYLLYPYKIDDRYEVINCGRSTEIERAADDLLELGKGETPRNKVDMSAGFEESSFNQYVWLTLIGAGVLILFFIIYRRNK